MKNFFFTAAIILAGLASANAQTTTATAAQTVTLILKNSISINITSASGTSFSFDNANKYSTGLTNTSASTIQVASNLPWAVTVKTTTANFSGPSATMPASILGVRLTGGSAFTSLSASATALTSGARGVDAFTVDYNANPGYDYDAGTYTISVVYTATQQ